MSRRMSSDTVSAMTEPAARIGHEHIERIHHRHADRHGLLDGRARWTAIIIALLAAILAIADLSAHRTTKTIIIAQSEAGSVSTRYEALDNHRATLDNDALLFDAIAGGTTSPQAVIARRTAEGRAARQAAQLGVEEGALAKKRDKLTAKAQRADERYADLEVGIGALQMAIVLASVSIVAAATWLLGAGVAAGFVGLIFTIYAMVAH
jgi:hypothetical protein